MENNSHSAISIRLANSNDLAELLELIKEFYEVDNHSYEKTRVETALKPLLNDDQFGVVWMIGEPVCGYAVVTWGYALESGGRDALLDEIYVRDRGAGIGSKALTKILADIRSRGINHMFLETESHNTKVRRFYARHGFVEEASTWMSVSLDTDS